MKPYLLRIYCKKYKKPSLIGRMFGVDGFLYFDGLAMVYANSLEEAKGIAIDFYSKKNPDIQYTSAVSMTIE